MAAVMTAAQTSILILLLMTFNLVTVDKFSILDVSDIAS